MPAGPAGCEGADSPPSSRGRGGLRPDLNGVLEFDEAGLSDFFRREEQQVQRDVEAVAKSLSHGLPNLPHGLPLEPARVDDEQVKVRRLGVAVSR